MYLLSFYPYYDTRFDQLMLFYAWPLFFLIPYLSLLSFGSDQTTKLEQSFWSLNPVIQSITPQNQNLIRQKIEQMGWPKTLTLSPTFIRFRKTRWTQKSIQTQLNQASLIYAQCGIFLDDLIFITLDHPLQKPELRGPYSVIKKPQDQEEDKLAQLFLDFPKPFVFWMGEIFKSRENPGGISAYAYGEYYIKDHSRPSLHTAWMSDHYINWDKSEFNFVKSSLDGIRLAHELGHILGNFMHLVDDDSNLMSAGPEKDALTHDQCLKLRSSSYVN